MSFDSAEFRRILGHWATGIAVVTTRTADGHPCGFTASAVSSVSLDPPLVLTCVAHSADTHACIVANRFFAINVLADDGERLSRRFASSDIDEKFDGIGHHVEITGAPILEEALGWVDCELHATFDGGDHSIIIGRVMGGDARDAAPLLYFRGGYRRLAT